MERTYIRDIKENKEVFLQGWCYELRDLAKIKFILLRDKSGVVQCMTKDEKLFKKFSDLTAESVISLTGLAKKADVKSKEVTIHNLEIEITNIELISKAETLPIQVFQKDSKIETELSTRLDYRFLDLHKKEVQAIFKVQSTLLQAYREFMIKEEAYECIFPSIIGASSEGGTEVFTVQYFEKEALLSQSCQLYKQMLACSIEKVFTIFTVWRAEKHNTLRHLNEARQMDYEQAFADDKVVMDVLARCVQYIIKEILEKNKEELELLNIKIKIPSVKYLTFAETKKLMKEHKVPVGDEDLNGDAEEKLGELFPDTIVFVHDWPLEGKPFYIMPKGKDLSHGFDAIYKGMEISSGGQRIHIPDLLIERLKAKDCNPENFKGYIDSFRYGAPMHSGFGIGVERLVMLILGISNIREVTLFPRDRDRLTP